MLYKKYSDQNRWAITVSLIVFGTFLANLGIGIQNVIGISQQMVSITCKSIVFGGLVWCAPTLLKKDIRPIIAILILFFATIILQELFFLNLNEWFSGIAWEFATLVLPMIVCLAMIDDYSVLLRYLVKTSYVVSVVVAISIFIFGGKLFSGYAMGFSDSLILPINSLMLYFAIGQASKLKKIVTLSFILLNCLAILLYGSRGSMAAVATFAMCLVLIFGPSGRKGIIFKITVIAISGILILCFDKIVSEMVVLASDYGFNSRTLTLLASNNASTDSGRNELWDAVWSDCLRDPLAVRGICSEYPIIGMYCHSIILTLWHSAGFLFGSVVLVILSALILRTLKLTKSASGLVALLCLSAFFPVGLWSGTIWTEPYFWSWITMQCKSSNDCF